MASSAAGFSSRRSACQSIAEGQQRRTRSKAAALSWMLVNTARIGVKPHRLSASTYDVEFIASKMAKPPLSHLAAAGNICAILKK